MVAAFNPVEWLAALLQGLIAAVGKVPKIFGVDGHFKPYFGKEPIDKGYNTKRRLAERGLSDVLIHDEQGRIWSGVEVGAGDRLSQHRARLLVQRDGDALLPALTNLTESVGAAEAMKMLRQVRGVQENDIKATRSFAHIDRLVDRGQARRAPDDRPVKNLVRAELVKKRRQARAQLKELSQSEPISAKDRARLAGKQFVAEAKEGILSHRIRGMPAKVPRVELEPEAERAWLKTKNRSLLQPLKYLLANGRRWLLSALGSALAPSDHDWDQTTTARTLEALIRAPGTVRFGTDEVQVTLDLPLPPQPHARLAQGLVDLDKYGLLFVDGRRRLMFRLAPRPTRQALPSAGVLQEPPENSN